MASQPLRGVMIGAGYFSQFHADAWARMAPDVAIAGVCDLKPEAASMLAAQVGARVVSPDELDGFLTANSIDFVDLATPPPTHRALCNRIAQTGAAILCQKPLGTDYADAQAIVAEMVGVRFMVHENWRWQPWHRKARAMLDDGTLGQLHSITFTCRMGDGWPHDAYLARQPYFRTYPRLFMYETGVHFLDLFRFLGGEITNITAHLARRNPEIAGEDAAIVLCRFASGASALLDASRYNEPEHDDPRYTFGTMRIDGAKGHLRLDADGALHLKLLGEPIRRVDFAPSREGFAGDSVRATLRHFTACLRTGAPFETSGEEYLRTLRLVEAAYLAQETGQSVLV